MSENLKVGNIINNKLNLEAREEKPLQYVDNELLEGINRFIRDNNIKQTDICGNLYKDEEGNPLFVPVEKCTVDSYRDFITFTKQYEICKSGLCRNGENCILLEKGLSPYEGFPLRKMFFSFEPLLSFKDAVCMVRMAHYEREEIMSLLPYEDFQKYESKFSYNYGPFDYWTYYQLRKVKFIIMEDLKKKRSKSFFSA